MSDNTMSDPSASGAAPSQFDMPYEYKGLSNELGYPNAPLPGKEWANQPGSAVQQGAARYQAEQAAIQANERAAKQAEVAKFNAAAAAIHQTKARKATKRG